MNTPYLYTGMSFPCAKQNALGLMSGPAIPDYLSTVEPALLVETEQNEVLHEQLELLGHQVEKGDYGLRWIIRKYPKPTNEAEVEQIHVHDNNKGEVRDGMNRTSGDMEDTDMHQFEGNILVNLLSQLSL